MEEFIINAYEKLKAAPMIVRYVACFFAGIVFAVWARG